MKSILDEESRKALVNYRMQRADESLEEALILCHTGHYNASMNRLYYACYYAIVAALLQKDVNVFCDQEMFEDSFPKAKMLIDAIKIMLAS